MKELGDIEPRSLFLGNRKIWALAAIWEDFFGIGGDWKVGYFIKDGRLFLFDSVCRTFVTHVLYFVKKKSLFLKY